MKRPDLALFGIPFSNLDKDEAVNQCIALLKDQKSNRYPYYATIFNLDLINKIYGWRSSTILNPELLVICRKLDMATISNKFLFLLASLLGSPCIQTIHPTEFLIKLCQTLGNNEKGIFLLGNNEKLTKNAGISLHDLSKGLRLVGFATPPIFIEGDDLSNALERDALLIEQINSSHADVLIINLESLKQELWFERVHQYLQTPIVLSVGKTLDFLEKSQLKSYNHTQTSNNSFKPDHLGFWNLFKLVCMSLPLIVFHNINRFVVKCIYTKPTTLESRVTQLFLSPFRSIVVLFLPKVIDASNVNLLTRHFEEASSHDVLVIDLRNLRHIQPEGFALLIHIWQHRNKQNKEVYLFSPTSDIQCLMKLHRVWDLYKDITCYTPDMLMSRLIHIDNTSLFFDTFTQQGPYVIISIFGSLNNTLDYEAYVQKLSPVIGQKNCVLDLSFCTYIDNTGFSFLLSLQKQLQNQGRHLILCSLSKRVHRQFQTAKLDTLFIIIKDINETRSLKLQ